MPCFFFNFRCGSEYLADPEGATFPDVTSARARGVVVLRAILADDVQAGTLHMSSSIEIDNDQHELVDRIEFFDALVLLA